MAGHYDFELLRGETRFYALAAEWDELWQASAQRSPFLSFEWVSMSWNRISLRHPDACCVALLREAGRLVVAVPLFRRQRYLVVREFRSLDTDIPQYNDALVRSGSQGEEQVKALLRELARGFGIHRLALDRLPAESSLWPVLQGMGARGRLRTTNTGIDLRRGFDAYFADRSPTLRSDHRRRLRRLAEVGAVSFRFSDAGSLDADIDWLFHRKRQWNPPVGRRRAWVDDAQAENGLRLFFHQWLARGLLRSAILSVDDRRIAVSVYFAGASALIAFMIAHDPDYARFAPGRSVSLLAIEAAAQEGLPYFDLMGGDHDWKTTLRDTEMPLLDVRVFLRQ
jgi:CelD/BcsL family acetyltransferase involved in cellulose biosynthesis